MATDDACTQATTATIPDGLVEQVRSMLDEHSESTWDAAVAEIAKNAKARQDN